MEKQLNETLARLRKKFGVAAPPGGGEHAEPDAKRPDRKERSVWPGDSISDTAADLEARHGIDAQRYRSSPLYRSRVNQDVPAYARAIHEEAARDKKG